MAFRRSTKERRHADSAERHGVRSLQFTNAQKPMTQPLQDNDLAALKRCKEAYDRIRAELSKVIVGQDQPVEQVLTAMLAGGHALLEGVPGLAKTLLISSIARSLHLSFKRIQFTPDLMPSDVTGAEVIQEDPETRQR